MTRQWSIGFTRAEFTCKARLPEHSRNLRNSYLSGLQLSTCPTIPNQQNTAPKSPPEVTPKRVFIVHGHDHQSLDQLRLLLMDLQLDPVVIQNMPGSGDTLIEKLENVGSTDYACVLLTPDDEGRVRNSDDKLLPRARQNVILELGMVLARLGRPRVAILLKGKTLERPSDIDGLIYIPFSNHVKETKNKLVANLHEAGFRFNPKDIVKS
ncbi:MAG: nucleotide-binding protein [Gammaproteobacteria bacterium]|nr:nucleotide-binding protein [Gammaproteobacteria bacterium]